MPTSFWLAGLFFPSSFIHQYHRQIQPHQSPAEKVAVAFQGLNQDKLPSPNVKILCDLAPLDLIHSHSHGSLDQALCSSHPPQRSLRVPYQVPLSLLMLFS